MTVRRPDREVPPMGRETDRGFDRSPGPLRDEYLVGSCGGERRHGQGWTLGPYGVEPHGRLEWAFGYALRFGLVSVDIPRPTLPKDGYRWFPQAIAANGLPAGD